MEPNVKMHPHEGVELEDPTFYRQLVGSLIYLTIFRSDLTYVVHVANQFMTASKSTHLNVIKMIQYVRDIMNYGMSSSSNSEEVIAYCDTDSYEGSIQVHLPTNGFCIFLSRSTIS